MSVEPLLTARDVAKAFGFQNVDWVLKQADAKKHTDPLPSFRFGVDGGRGPVRFRASEVEAWVRRRSTVHA
jgi:hypothetical protein